MIQRMSVPRCQYWVTTRTSLLSRLKHKDDNPSWTEFFEIYGCLIHNAAVRGGFKDFEADDVLQETILKVRKNIPKFRYDPERGTFRGWLLRITKNEMTEFHRRATRDRRRGVNLSAEDAANAARILDELPDPYAAEVDRFWDREWDQHLWAAAIERVKSKVSVINFQIFDAFVLQEWTLAQVTKRFGVRAHQVYVAKYRLTKMLEREVKELMGKSFEDFCR